MSIRLVALLCLGFWAGYLSAAVNAAPPKEHINLAGQWDLTIKYGRQELHGFLLLRQNGNDLEGDGRDHADFKLHGAVDPSKNPPRVVWTRQYLDAHAGEPATFSGDLRFQRDLPDMSGQYDVWAAQPGQQITKKSALHGGWEAGMLERRTPGFSPTYLTPGDYLINGDSYVKRGDYRNAVNNFTDAIRLNPKDALPYLSRGSAYNRLGQPEKALADFTQAINLDPDDALAFVNRGLAHAKLGHLPEAIADCTTAIKLNPKDSLAYRQRGTCLLNLRHYDKALEDYNQATILNPSDGQAHYYRGLSNSKLGRYQASVEDFSKAININAQDANAWRDRGRAYSELGDNDKAIDDYTEAVSLNPKDRLAYMGRGLAYAHRAVSLAKQGQEHKAIADDYRAVQDYARATPQNVQALLPVMLAGAVSVVALLGLVFLWRLIRSRRQASAKTNALDTSEM